MEKDSQNEIIILGNLMDESNKNYAGYRVYGGGGISPSICASGFKKNIFVTEVKQMDDNTKVNREWVWKINEDYYQIRIRRLTPRENWRLMGFSDEDFDKAAKVCSSSQLYKQAGNSIVKGVLMHLFKQMIKE